MGIELGRGKTEPILTFYDDFAGDVLSIFPIGKLGRNLRSYKFDKPFANKIPRTDYESKLDELLVYHFKRFIHGCDRPLRYNEKVKKCSKNIPNAYYTFKYNFKPGDIRLI